MQTGPRRALHDSEYSSRDPHRPDLVATDGVARAARLRSEELTEATPAAPAQAARGQSMVEFALVVPVLLLLLFGIIDFGYVFNSYHEIRSASRDGARLAVVDNGCFPGGPDEADTTKCSDPDPNTTELTRLKNDIKARAAGLANPGNITVLVYYKDGAQIGTDNVCVTVRYPAGSLTGYLGFILNNITLESTAVMRLEQAPTFGKDGTTCP